MDSQNDTPLGFWGTESEEIIARQFPLHRACRDGDVVALSRLVAEASREQMLCEDRFYGWTPIHWSAYFGKVFLFCVHVYYSIYYVCFVTIFSMHYK